jgi:peptide/nickel transport system substrate-binding protein
VPLTDRLVVLSVAAVALLSASSAFADQSSWPREWFEPAKTASQIGLTQFRQSPYLDDQNLPPLAERLPPDPVVVYPLDKIGRYGGNARVMDADWWTFVNHEHTMTISADLSTFLPNTAESWTVSEDGRTITLRLREGIKWSDGVPLTSDDFEFTFNDLWLDEEYSPVVSVLVTGGSFVKHDALTFSYVFEEPYPTFVNLLAQFGNYLVVPKHFYRNFHPKYVDRDELSQRIKDMGYLTWMSFVNNCRLDRVEDSAFVPTLRPYIISLRTPTLVRFVRNPYYFKVDPAGNQLPYIDTVDAEVIENIEVATAKASTGQLDFAAYEMRTQDIPLLKLGERTGAIKVHVWRRLHGSDVVIQPNYNHKNEKLAALFWDKRFRHALSYAMNREEMNEIIYFGRGVPRQVTVHPSSSFYEPEFAFAHIEYKPDYARALLDEIGLEDVDGDGLREYPGGERLTITLEFIDWETPKGINLELIANYWRAVGIDLRLKLVDSNLQNARAIAGEMEMTVWHGDRVTDVLFPVSPDWWVPRGIAWDRNLWNDWSRFYMTDGRLGEEPPDVIKNLNRWYDGMRAAVDPEVRVRYGKKILASSAENLWTIGAVGLAPHPVVVSKRLKNVPAEATWGWDTRWTLAYHPATWYFEE